MFDCSHMADGLRTAVLAACVVLLGSCGESEKFEDLEGFGRAILSACKESDTSRLADGLSATWDDFTELRAAAERSGIKVQSVNADKKIKQVAEMTADAVELFVRSYKELCNRPFAKITTRSNELALFRHMADARASKAIIWVSSEKIYEGITIFLIVHTSNGYKVASWYDQTNPSLFGRLQTSRIILECSDISKCQ
jgi:hypothetical protein